MLDKALQVLQHLYNSQYEMGVSEISSDLNIPKTTVFRLMSTLQKWGYVEKDESSDKYSLGKTLIKLGQRATKKIDIKDIALPIMNNISHEIGESVNLGILYENEVLTIANSKGEAFYLISRLIPVSPLNCSAMGKVFLSNFSNKDLKKYFELGKMEKRTINSIVDLETFLIEREKIIADNIAYDREEYEYGLTCIAVPVYDVDKEILAAISVSGPSTRLRYKNEKKVIELLLKASNLISKTYIDTFQDN